MHMNIGTLKPSESDPTHDHTPTDGVEPSLKVRVMKMGFQAEGTSQKNLGEILGKSSGQRPRFIRRSKSWKRELTINMNIAPVSIPPIQ